MSIETRVRVDGEWTSRRVGIDQLLNDCATSSHSKPVNTIPSPPSLGLLSQTIAPSPVIQWVFHAQVRSAGKDDVVFVGDDFITVKEISHEGHLQHVLTERNFDSRIQSASILGGDEAYPFGLQNLKLEYDEEVLSQFPNGSTRLPPHVLVLVLDTQELIFTFVVEDENGRAGFLDCSIPLPPALNPLQRMGKHLAVDPMARAVAVAASEDAVLLYSSKNMEGLRSGSARWGRGFLPISHERPVLKVPGNITRMDFLYPPENDLDHVILLLVVVQDRKTKLVQIDWLYSQDIQSARIHTPQRIHTGLIH